MSILIKNMTIPKSCDECPFGKEKQLDVGIICTLLDGTTLDTTSRPTSMCPLVELPPHGDLIEKQAVLNILSQKNAAWDGYDNVMKLPTIIESEGEDG